MRLPACLIGVSLFFATAQAAADGPGDARLAQALFEEGRTLMDQKRYAEACPKLKESQRLDPGGGTLLNLAACHAAEGKTASALDEYHESVSLAIKDGRTDREQIARTNIEKLEHEVPRVTVLVPRPVTGIDVKLDTTPLAPAAWGVATPVDPGTHVVLTNAPGYQTVRVTFEVRAGDRKVIEVPAAKKDDGAVATAPSEPRHAPLPIIATRTDPNPVFWSGLITGVAALSLSALTGALTVVDTLEANDNCTEKRTYCKDADARDSLSNARTFGWVSTISLGVSAVGFMVAILAPSRKSSTRRIGSLSTVGFQF